ncbi:MAG: DegV family protein [Anaerolineales bacterium]
MSKIALLTDSTSYIPAEYVKKYNITILPQVVIWDGVTYEDGVDIQPDEFYARLKTAKNMPTTSQVSIAKMQQTFSRLLGEGYEVLGIFLSEKLSGTIQSALQAREHLETGKDKVHIVDSGTTIMSLGFQVIAAARALENGADIAGAKTAAEAARAATGVFFAVDTLEFLHRGGRIGGAQRFIGSALNLKPILTISNGRVEAVERIRTKAKAHDRIIELVVEQCKGKSPIRIAAQHAAAEEDAQALLEKVKAQVEVTESMIAPVSAVIGTHVGPGTVALAFVAGV